eukprot:g2163.t1
MQSQANIVTTLHETQESLSKALARIEEFQILQQHLLEENLRLRDKLENAFGGESVNSVSSQSLSYPSLGIRPDGDNFSLLEEYPIILHTKKGKVAGTLSARSEYLEISESRAKVTRGQTVDITQLPDKTKFGRKSIGNVFSSTPPNNRTRQWTLFGKSKTAEDVNLQTKDKTPNQSPPVAPVLKRNSWSGSMKAPNDQEVSKGDSTEDNKEPTVWKVTWKDDRNTKKTHSLIFETQGTAEAFMKRQMRSLESDSGGVGEIQSRALSARVAPEKLPSFSAAGSIVPGKGLLPGRLSMELPEFTDLLTEHRVQLLISGIPPRHRHGKWNLLYSTERHGISLNTLLRKAQKYSPSVLVIQDSADFIFGCYCSEPWKTSHRFYGTGETFVFQLEPKCVYYPWKQKSAVPNNFFMFASNESLSVGGTGRFALWLDSDLLEGRSGTCDTFGSPCIASSEEFKIMKVELWAIT